MPFVPAGLLTLTTDFGTADPFAGIMKGRIHQQLPRARVVDLSHAIPPGRADLAGFWLGRSWLEFPQGTVHVAVVDPGVGTSRGVVLAQCSGHLLLAPDNGLLAEALRGVRGVAWRRMDPGLPARLLPGPMSRTFHGRDLFAPLAGLLAAGTLEPADFGPPAEPLDPRPLPRAVAAPDRVRGEVLLADHFGNLITNIGAALLTGMTEPVARIAGRTLPLLGTYAAAAPGELLAVVNAFSLVEVAVRDGSAAATLHAGPGCTVDIRNCSASPEA